MVSYVALTDRSAVVWALDKFDLLGRHAFLNEYGYAEARDYFLVRDEKRYDTKPVFAAAYERQLGERPEDIDGGKHGVAKRLSELGFDIEGLDLPVRERAASSGGRSRQVTAARIEAPKPVCDSCWMELPVTGVCPTCAA